MHVTTVWNNFQANTCSKKSSARLFWVYWGKRMLWRFFPRVLRKVLFNSCSRQWNSNEEKRTCNCSCNTITNYYQWSTWSNWEKLAFQSLHYHATEPWGDVDMLVFKNRMLSSSCWLSWKLALIKEDPARVLLTWLLQCEQTLLDWSSVCEKKKILWSFRGTG